MERDEPITDSTISTDRLYTSIESRICLLDRGIVTVETFQKGRSGIPSDCLCNLLFSKIEEEYLPDNIHRQNKVKKKCCCVIDFQTIAWQRNWWWKRKAPNNQALRLHKTRNGYSRPAGWLLYHQIKVLPLGYGSSIVYVGSS